MVNVITANQSGNVGLTLNNDDLTIVTSGVVVVGTLSDGIDATNTDVQIFGNVIGAADGIDFNVGGGQPSREVTVGLTGTVTGEDDGIDLAGIQSRLTVAGLVEGADSGIVARGDDTRVHITQTGVVKGGSNQEGDDGDVLAAAIVNIGNAGFTVINDGTLIGDLSPDNGLRIAFVDGGFTGLLPNDGVINDARFDNTGSVTGDLFFLGGEDVYDARGGGIVNGRIDLGSGNDIFRGGSTDEEVFGGDDQDAMHGGAGADTLNGGGGNDTLEGGLGGDILNGGAGADTASYDRSSSSLFISLTTGTVGGGHASGDTIMSIENVIATAFNDTLFGDGGGNSLFGGGGNDSINGQAGNDIVGGGPGADILDGGVGADLVTYATSVAPVFVSLASGAVGGGDATGDTIFNIEGVIGSNFGDTLLGGAGNETLLGNGGDDYLAGRGGADSLDGGAGSDTASYEGSSSAVFASLATGTVGGGDATGDTITSIENLMGSSFNDTLLGDTGPNQLSGGAGADVMHGRGGNDTLTGGLGSDTFIFNVGDDDDVIDDWNTGNDFIQLGGFGYASQAAAFADFAQVGSDVVFTNGPDTLTLVGATLGVDVVQSDLIV